jgi:hypothetical protein
VHVVYILCDTTKDNKPFYVGYSEIKSKFDRLFSHLEDAFKQPKDCNLHKARTIKRIIDAGLKVTTCVLEISSKEEGLNFERRLIKLFGRSDKNEGCLTNLTDGGDGFRGWTEKQRQHQREAVGKPYIEKYGQRAAEIKQKISSSKKGRKQSPEHVSARAKSMLGKNKGKKTRGSRGMSWFNDGVRSMLMLPEKGKELNFSRGRLPLREKK